MRIPSRLRPLGQMRGEMAHWGSSPCGNKSHGAVDDKGQPEVWVPRGRGIRQGTRAHSRPSGLIRRAIAVVRLRLKESCAINVTGTIRPTEPDIVQVVAKREEMAIVINEPAVIPYSCGIHRIKVNTAWHFP